MPLIVEEADPGAPGAAALLRMSHELMESLFPPEENHFLDIEALRAPHMRFFAARQGADVVGTIALAIRDGWGEVKSMFVADLARGTGAADALLRQVEDRAREEGLEVLRLETGDALRAARTFYARHGFREREPFGEYTANASSIFMEKSLET
ncbi:putative acetyltransferase [Palleronia aestuarii]|uniref:Putative acetyltransferase n=1 Tax=Palleronia aestuarii TaxID=568105 RepID=A0A2W7QBF5_9RHOB|nr:GNAT family N-acetyltransferase [Palleronia aestuarii]PZX19079.1 putative acetyltransferase [Palleronia aestuarii]